MAGGYMGKILFVDLSAGELKDEVLDEKLCRDFIGGYGIGARILYNRQKTGVDPLGPENTLGFITGPLTGTPATTGTRYTAVAKSPLTGGWGDANSGGYFGPHLKFAGYDAVFFNGIADKPVYLLIDNGKAELRDASYLWGKDTYETEDVVKTELGEAAEIVCIGPSGEKLSLLSCIITRRGAAAARSGLGAVMGSKKLKAVAVSGNRKVPLIDSVAANSLRREHIAQMREAEPGRVSYLEQFHKYGTSGGGWRSAHSGDTPVKNWGGVGIIDFPDRSGLARDEAIANLERRTGCWRCPIACEGRLKEGRGEYKYPAGTRRVEYETQGSFGTMCLNNNTESINMANHICNSYGLDTISTGTVIAFAIECYENGLITKADTGSIELTWGNHQAIVAMTEKIAKREGFGDILTDGVKIAAEKIGKGADQYAIHIGGQELGMHDPKLMPAYRTGQPAAARYQMDATPGRHMQGFGPTGFQGHLINAAGLCMFGNMAADPGKYIAGFMNAVTGWDYSMEELLKAGERIANMRHVFNLREGINPLQWKIHPRIIGVPPQKEGPLANVTADIEAQVYWNLGALDWDRLTTKPSRKKLLELSLDDVAEELWPK
ncbi:MAG: aldehyde ferredoxin oxidoreductase family protein [Dehalococcoidales bacterium]|nr:MAG: aldehyde ferredoxin oxidoreductase family protein [Dehalococcoidales bacterium]